MSTFPSSVYSDAKTDWIGQEHIVAPTVARALQNWKLIKQKRVLDVGCGTGELGASAANQERILKRLSGPGYGTYNDGCAYDIGSKCSFGHDILQHGASEVLGLDNSLEMIEIARNTHHNVRHKFLHSSLLDLNVKHEFEVAVSFFVLQFMKDKKELTKALRKIFESLQDNGILVAIVPNGIKGFNPAKEEGEKFGAAINLKSNPHLWDGRRLPVDFFKNGEIVGSSTVTFFFNETYEQILKETGFKKVEFLPPVVSKSGTEQYGEEYFRSYMNPPKDIIIRAYKDAEYQTE